MNYRHAYHAGNFADVLKHAILVLVIEHMKLKPAPFRVIDTHAGIGRYDLASEAAQKTGEWRDGIGRILERAIPHTIAGILAPYLGVVSGENAQSKTITFYPGSPIIARQLLRRGDQLIVNELHPDDNASLKALFAGDPQTKVLNIDGWAALKSLLPPKERRAVVLVDPPFEEAGEFERLVSGLAAAERRFATGTVLLWYPVKNPGVIRTFHNALAALRLPKLLYAELYVRAPLNTDILNGAGLIVFNPPFTLHDNLATLLPFVADTLALGPQPSHRLGWLSQ